MNRLIILGASGHGKVVADIAHLNGYNDIVFLDNNIEIKECLGYPVIGNDSAVDELEGDLFIAIGNSSIRKRLMNTYSNRFFPVLIHPSAVVAKDVVMNPGSVVMAGAVINSGTIIGKGVIINTCSSVDHDCIVSNYVHVAVGAHICGTVNIGSESWIGAGAIIKNNVYICENCLIGAGAVVVKNINSQGTYVGVPAKAIL